MRCQNAGVFLYLQYAFFYPQAGKNRHGAMTAPCLPVA